MLLIPYLFIFDAVTSNKPSSDRRQSVWRVECELGLVTDEDCPIDGGWAPWAPWSRCHGTCDGVGYKTRERQCNNPVPSYDGLPCSGESQQVEECYLNNCSIEDYRNLVKNNTIRSDALHQLECFPTILQQCLTSLCSIETIKSTLKTDNVWQIQPETLWNSLICVKYNMGCPTFGEWGPWAPWSLCSARCGRGMRSRLRLCDTPPPSDAYLICQGLPLEKEECEGDQCALDDLYGQNNTTTLWLEWKQWSPCSEKCGLGVKRRKRICNESNTGQTSENWETHCRGQHSELKICENEQCSLDGGWSGWSFWSPCSTTCGAGKRTRVRSCTRPVPAGKGAICVGPTKEHTSCHDMPCQVLTHVVAVLNGDSYLKFDLEKKHSALFHFYIRFLPLSPHGTLVRRGNQQNPNVRLSLHKWHICLEAHGLSRTCTLPRLCSPVDIEPGTWHTVLTTVTTQGGTLRIDDSPEPIKSYFLCDPELFDDEVVVCIGEKFNGEIQEAILNFRPLTLIVTRNQRKINDVIPSSASNVVYEHALIEEGFRLLDAGQYLRIPCFENQNEWNVTLTLKPKGDTGTIFYMSNRINFYLHLMLQSKRIKVKSIIDTIKSESISSSEYTKDQWLDILISKKQGMNSIEISVNQAEHIHSMLEDTSDKKRRETKKHNSSTKDASTHSILMCRNEFYIGGIPVNLEENNKEEFAVLSGVIASLKINNELQDLHKFNLESRTGDKVSSRSASVSDVYHETFWGLSNTLNLTCLHSKLNKSSLPATWLHLDTKISREKNKFLRSTDDGKVLKLTATANSDFRGFYTCRAFSNGQTRNFITYGVRGHVHLRPTRANGVTIIALITSLTLVITTFAWLFIQGIDDLRHGYGFFRDRNITPEEEADSVCEFIDKNIDLIGCENLARIAKAKARRRCRKLIRQAKLISKGKEDLGDGENLNGSDESTQTEEELPPLSTINSGIEPVTHAVYLCEPSYMSSPVHGSDLTNNKPYISLSSSQVKRLSSRQFVESNNTSSTEDVSIRKRKRLKNTRKQRSSLLTIKSSTFHIKPSTAQKVLRRFQELRSDD